MFKHEAVAQGQEIFNEAAREEMKKRYLELDRLRGGDE